MAGRVFHSLVFYEDPANTVYNVWVKTIGKQDDPRVKKVESDQIVRAIRKTGKPVQYLLFSDEGHGTATPENDLKAAAAQEALLARCLGGRCEPPSEGEKSEELLK